MRAADKWDAARFTTLFLHTRESTRLISFELEIELQQQNRPYFKGGLILLAYFPALFRQRLSHSVALHCPPSLRPNRAR